MIRDSCIKASIRRRIIMGRSRMGRMGEQLVMEVVEMDLIVRIGIRIRSPLLSQ